MYILVGTLLGWNMNFALFYNFSLDELYVRSVYFNILIRVEGGVNFMKHFWGGRKL
jgi:hypothetical protein